SGDGNGAIRRWRVDKGREIRTLAEQANVVDWVAFSPDGQTLLTTGEGKIVLWEPLTGQPRTFVDAQLPFASQKTLSPDGKMLALIEPNRSQIFLYDVATGKPLLRFDEGAQLGRVYFCRFSPHGRRLAAGSFL